MRISWGVVTVCEHEGPKAALSGESGGKIQFHKPIPRMALLFIVILGGHEVKVSRQAGMYT